MTPRQSLVVVVSAAAMWLAVGCGDDDGPAAGTGGSSAGTGGPQAGTGGGTTWTWEQYVEASIDAACTQTFQCPLPNDDQLGARSVLRTMERCRTYYRTWPQFVGAYAQTAEAIAAGRLVFDGAKAAECAARHAPCDPVSSPPAETDPCSGVLVGAIALGAECYGRRECAGSAYCASDTYSCPGHCSAKKTTGQACEDSPECEGPDGSASCDRRVDPSVCALQPILRGAPLGAECGLLATGIRELCAPGLWCDGAFSGLGTCRGSIPIGEACTNNTPCEGLAFCDDATDTCQDISVLDQVGAACDEEPGIPRRMCDPLARLICVNGACELAGDGGVNSRCVPGDLGDASCQPGFYCEWGTHICLPLRATGDECSSSQECAVACDYGTNTCSDRSCGL